MKHLLLHSDFAWYKPSPMRQNTTSWYLDLAKNQICLFERGRPLLDWFL